MIIDVCFACDENYAPYAAVSLRSAVLHCPPEDALRVWILNDGISKKTLRWFGEKFPKLEIHFIEVPAGLLDRVYIRNQHLSRVTYARLAMGELLPAYVTRLVYLDCDVLVRADLGELYRFDLRGKTLGGSVDWGVWLWRKQKTFLFPFDGEYINAGVLLVDLKNWRERNCGEKCFAYMRKPDYPILYEDQDVLNFTLHQDIALFPVKWNTMLCFPAKKVKTLGLPQAWPEALEKPGIVHFTSSDKPWWEQCSLPYAKEFQQLMSDLGIPFKRYSVRQKIMWVSRYWYYHPVFFLKPKFWKKWREKGWKTFF